MNINKECGEMTNTSQKPKFEYCMNEQLKNLLTEIKTCSFSILVDKGYTGKEAHNAIDKIKNFNVYEIETGFRIETIVDGYEITVFHHNDEIKVVFYCNEEHKMHTKTITVTDENDALNQGRIVNGFEHQINDRLEKFENWLSSLQSLVDTVADSLNDVVKERVQNLEKHIKCVESDVKLINGKLKFIADNLSV